MGKRWEMAKEEEEEETQAGEGKQRGRDSSRQRDRRAHMKQSLIIWLEENVKGNSQLQKTHSRQTYLELSFDISEQLLMK